MSARQPWTDEFMPIRLRTAGAEDHERVARFLAAMDRDGLYQRHFAHGEAPNLALLSRLAATDGIGRVAVIALNHVGEVLAHAEYVATDGGAEYALMVLPQLRGIGLGRRLLAALQELAAAAGQRQMHGIVQAGNTPAIQLALKLGFRVAPGADRTTVIVSRDLEPARLAATVGRRSGAEHYLPPSALHDPDRTPLYRRPGP
jgi:GNAT superfamily N-acetyltransferase